MSRRKRNLVESSGSNTPPGEELKTALKQKAHDLGLWLAGVTDASPASTLPQYEAWLQAGYHGEMHYLARPDRLERRKDLRNILPNIQSVVLVLLPYWPGSFPTTQQDPLRGSISCYAWGQDYHDLLGEQLRQLATWLVEQAAGSVMWYVDTGPIQERELAARAGLGFIGKHTLLIHPRYGSGFFLGELLTTHKLTPDPPATMPSCGTCQRCMIACPTQAIVGPYVLDARRCISYLTIELKGSIPEDLRPALGNLIYGCDICQQACPWMKFAGSDPSPLWGIPEEERCAPQLIALLQLDETQFQQRFANTPIQRLGRSRLLRNVAVALGNSGDPVALVPLRQAVLDTDPFIREHAQWAIEKILASSPSKPCDHVSPPRQTKGDENAS